MYSIVMRLCVLWCCSVCPALATQVLVLGDSLSAAHNLPVAAGWVQLLESQLRTVTPLSKVHNASISGETSAGGAERIDTLLLEHQPDIVVLELGANDSLRGLSISQTRENLRRILRAASGAGAKVLLVGIELPVNYGRRYRDGLRQMYGELATAHADSFVPHLLSALGNGTEHFQSDGLHPTAAAQAAILQTVWSAWPQSAER
jgi:acyl-CoA thioesterase-1